MAQKQHTYETTFIVNASLDDPQIDAVIEKVKEVITKHNGEILELVKWDESDLPSPLRRKITDST